MNSDQIKRAKEIYSLTNDKDFWKPFFPEPHAIASIRIANWHLSKLQSLQGKYERLVEAARGILGILEWFELRLSTEKDFVKNVIPEMRIDLRKALKEIEDEKEKS